MARSTYRPWPVHRRQYPVPLQAQHSAGSRKPRGRSSSSIVVTLPPRQPHQHSTLPLIVLGLRQNAPGPVALGAFTRASTVDTADHDIRAADDIAAITTAARTKATSTACRTWIRLGCAPISLLLGHRIDSTRSSLRCVLQSPHATRRAPPTVHSLSASGCQRPVPPHMEHTPDPPHLAQSTRPLNCKPCNR